MHSINFYNFEKRKDYKQGIEGSGENCPEWSGKNSSWQDGRVFSDLSPAEKTEEKGKLGQNNEIFCGVLRLWLS